MTSGRGIDEVYFFFNLRFYDFLCRYISSDNVVRSALVQDLGRAARHTEEESMTATILVSSILDNQLRTKDRAKGLKKGILRMTPGT